MKKYILIFLLLFSSVFAENFSFKDKLFKAKKGDFIVFEFNKFYSALCVFNLEDKELILEEITISKNKFDKNVSFRNWIENGARKNSSWTIYKIDLETNKIKDAFSICKNSWIKLTTNESLISGLLDINLTKLNEYQRKKIGPVNLKNKIDSRPFWNPPKIVDLQKITNSQFDVYRSRWPDDGSEFATKVFDIYFSDDFSFPYFIEIKNGNLSYFLKAVDSGENLKSTIQYFPRKKAEIVQIKSQQEMLFLKVTNADHYNDFNLFAIDFSRKEKIIHPLKFIIKKEKDCLQIQLYLKDLNKIFERNHKYKFVLTPQSHKEIFIESKNLLLWN